MRFQFDNFSDFFAHLKVCEPNEIRSVRPQLSKQFFRHKFAMAPRLAWFLLYRPEVLPASSFGLLQYISPLVRRTYRSLQQYCYLLSSISSLAIAIMCVIRSEMCTNEVRTYTHTAAILDLIFYTTQNLKLC